MIDTSRDAGSFRDPSGHVHLIGGRVFRTVHKEASQDYQFVRDSGALDALIDDGSIIDTRELDSDEIPPELGSDVVHVLEHAPIDFISYPYEWSFSLLKAAALAHLDLQLRLLDYNIVLIDASAFNIQFRGPKPVFIDVLSLRRYIDGSFWVAHKQFCEHFLNPLLLRAGTGVTHNSWFRGNLEGIPTRDLVRVLPLKSRLSWNAFTHVTLQAKLEADAVARPSEAINKAKSARILPRMAYRGMITQLRNWLARLQPKDTGPTIWGDYSKTNTYSGEEAAYKRRAIAEFAAASKPRCLVDIGCNTGDYSVAALEGGTQHVIGFDFDQKALDIAYSRAITENRDLLPLWLDAANPSPDQGWRQAERKGLSRRMPADAVIALAFEHHLAIARNIPLGEVVEWLVSMGNTGVIEFVPKEDETVQRMLALREDIFPEYNEAAFASALGGCARIEKSECISKSGRTLFWFDRT